MLLGCIADDFTGATDLANTLTRQGMKSVLVIGTAEALAIDAEAVVVALKSRTITTADAVAQSLIACRWLVRNGAQQIFFKYCSTFDSTDKGNIGPVADALMDELGADVTTLCPAFPENKRTVYLGHLFVGNDLLSDSSMRNHPLTPMTDANLIRVMARQSRYKVTNIAYPIVRNGADDITDAIDAHRKAGYHHIIVDALADEDLLALGTATRGLKLVTGGSGAALGLPQNFRELGLLQMRHAAEPLIPLGGPAVVIAGSCSAATLQQVETFRQSHPAMALDIDKLFVDIEKEAMRLADWVLANTTSGPALVYTTATPDQVRHVQERHGHSKAGERIEQAWGMMAKRVAGRGIRRFVVAGGETSGAVTKALGVSALQIGKQIAPGVPATQSLGNPRLGLVLKSGNFGGPDFFAEAVAAIP